MRSWYANGARSIYRLIEDNRGVTAIEYSLIGVLISIAAVAMFSLVGTNLTSMFSSIAAKL